MPLIGGEMENNVSSAAGLQLDPTSANTRQPPGARKRGRNASACSQCHTRKQKVRSHDRDHSREASEQIGMIIGKTPLAWYPDLQARSYIPYPAPADFDVIVQWQPALLELYSTRGGSSLLWPPSTASTRAPKPGKANAGTKAAGARSPITVSHA